MTQPIIALCSSAAFFDRLWGIKEGLTKSGYTVLLPSMQDFHQYEEVALAKIHHDLIRDHFRKIDQSNAIYVANYDKNGIEGYIGGNSFLEMGKAFDREIPIFLLNNVPKTGYREELLALQPIVIGQDWDKIRLHLPNQNV